MHAYRSQIGGFPDYRNGVGSLATENGVILENGMGIMAQPNPFNPTVTISFLAPPKHRETSLKIFDLRGRLVGDLTSQVKGKRSGAVTWNAGNLASGMYINHYQAGAQVLKNRVTLIK